MKRAILLVAYGASNIQSKACLRDFENTCRARFPEWPIRWAFTSVILRQRLAKQKQKSDSVRKAILRLHYEHFQAVAIQPLQTICGREYEDVLVTAEEIAANAGILCQVGSPLLKIDWEISKVAETLLEIMPEQRERCEDIVFMGHGARHPASELYEKLGGVLNQLDGRAHIGTMNGITKIEDILPRLSSKRVWLMPLLSVIGRHALNDMAGSDPASWKSRIELNGHECMPVLKGMAEFQNISNIWLDHLQTAIQAI